MAVDLHLQEKDKSIVQRNVIHLHHRLLGQMAYLIMLLENGVLLIKSWIRLRESPAHKQVKTW